MMKKLFGVICLLLTLGLLTNQAKAQVDFGIRGGVNFATFNDIDANVESRTGLMIGAYLSYPISNSPISIQPAVLYTQKGATTDGLTENNIVEVKLDYIEIPVLAKFDYITDGGLTPFVYFGPYIGFNLSADAEYTDGDITPGVDIEDNVKSTDFGIVVGAGLGFGQIDVGIRYSAGLTPIFEDALNSDAKNGVISIAAGLGF